MIRGHIVESLFIGAVALCMVGGLIGGWSQSRETEGAASIPVESVRQSQADSLDAAPILYAVVLDEIHWRESRRGADPKCRQIGLAGEVGEFQIRPIFIADVERIAGYRIDPADFWSCRKGITIWLSYYAPRVGAETVDEMYELYRCGPSGFRRQRGER